MQVSFGTPRVYRARTVRELQALKANPDAVPTVDREFSRTERLLIRVDAYAPGGVDADRHRPAPQPRRHVDGGSARADARRAVPRRSISRCRALAAGDYLIEINAKTESGTAQEMVAFRVGR